MPPSSPFSVKAMASSEARESLVYIAKLAKQSKRYDVMVDAMKKVAKLDLELTEEERDLLADGFRNEVCSRLEWWKRLSSILKKEEEEKEAKGNEATVKRIRDYMEKVESELSTICADLIAVVDEHLIPSSSTCESTVFFYLMKGNLYKYLAEMKFGPKKKEVADPSHKAYQTAFNTAESYLPPTHPMRLGVALNFSVFYYEIMNSPESACRLTKLAFDEAISVSELDNLSEDSFQEITWLMEAMKHNLNLWTTDILECGDNPRMDYFAEATDGEDDE